MFHKLRQTRTKVAIAMGGSRNQSIKVFIEGTSSYTGLHQSIQHPVTGVNIKKCRPCGLVVWGKMGKPGRRAGRVRGRLKHSRQGVGTRPSRHVVTAPVP